MGKKQQQWNKNWLMSPETLKRLQTNAKREKEGLEAQQQQLANLNSVQYKDLADPATQLDQRQQMTWDLLKEGYTQSDLGKLSNEELAQLHLQYCLGYYKPETHTIYSPYCGFEKVMKKYGRPTKVHEQTHAQGPTIQVNIINDLKKRPDFLRGGYVKADKWDDAEEIYCRLNEARYLLGLKPGDTIDLKFLEQNKHILERVRFDRYGNWFVLLLFNAIARAEQRYYDIPNNNYIDKKNLV